MRSKRRNSIGEVSLFSFQDIIMSTAGVMIMLMLLFSISVSMSSKRNSKTEAKTAETVNEQISINIQELQDQLEEFRKQEEAVSILHEIKVAQQAAIQNKDALTPTLAELDRQAVLLKEAKVAQERKQQQLETLLAMLRHSDPLRKVTLKTSDPAMRRAIIVECSKELLTCGTLDSERVASFEYPGKLKQFAEFVTENSSYASRPLVFLAKPSSREYSGALAQILREKGFTVGIDPLEENATVVHGGRR